ncbi:MAG: Uma2 family endonuclease [Anaerolineae bacterium]|nr:Uma2 family endonuclease [Anaerolineae bacterium]
MSTVTVPKISHPVQTRIVEVPPLNPGDYLTRAEFERIYEAHPEIKKAELLEGVVYMPSPIGITRHSEPHAQLITWCGVYAAATPGVRLGDNGTVRLDWENEVQPDAFLWIETERGGKARLTPDDYLEGAPEFIAEVAASSAAYDLHIKKRVYQRSGVQEYLAIQMHEKRVDWFVLQEGVYTNLPEENKMIKSKVFPGLWLNVEAFWAGNIAQLLATVQEGIASAEHTEFVTRLQQKESQ